MSAGAPTEYEVAAQTRTGTERFHRYATGDPLRPGQVLRLEGRYWLVETVDATGSPARATAKPARYRVELRHPDGRVEAGAFRRFRPDAPRLGHEFSTVEDGQPVSWEIVDERLAHDDQGEPFLELAAERDYGEFEQLPDHELEHALAAGSQRLPEEASALLSRAEDAGLGVELVALEPGEVPDWSEGRRYIDDLILEEIEDDLLELCGVNPGRDPREGWLETVQDRLRADLESLRRDVERDHDEVEEWEFLDGRIYAAVGSFGDEAEPDSGYGWLCRLVDASALGAAGFRRVRKAELQIPE